MSIVGTDEMLDRIEKLEAMLQIAMGAMETAIDTMDKPHYGCRDNQLDNACDARNGLVYILQELIEYQEKGMKNE